MSADDLVDVTCRGLKVAQKARLVADGKGGGFVEHEAPLPVGSKVQLHRDGQVPVDARVVAVVEQEASGKHTPGMRLSWGGAPAAVAPEAAAPEPQEAHDTTVMAAVEMPSEEEPRDTAVMASVPEPVDESSEKSLPVEEGGGRRGKKKRRPNGR